MKVKSMPKQNPLQPFLAAYPNLAEWINDVGWIEIGNDGFSRSMLRVLDEGGIIWESADDAASIDETLQAADIAIDTWLNKNGFNRNRISNE